MALLRPLDKMPTLDVAVILLVGSEETLLRELGKAIVKESEGTLKVQVHMALSLPLPTDQECILPRIDLIVFVLSIHSKHSLRTVELSLPCLDSSFFLGKVCFLATGVRKEQSSSVHRDTVVKMASTYQSPLLFSDLQVEHLRVSMAQRLIRILQICAGHMPGISALNLLSLMKPPTQAYPP